ncbi:hypothetical protein ACM91Z_002788 [Cronobacter dublinensis]
MKNNAELSAAGHELAKCLDSNTPLLDIAKMIVRLADKLEVTTLALREKTKQCEQLAAENAALKSAIQTHSESTHFCEVCGKDDPCSTDDVCYALKETPSTDAFLREVRAQGVEMLGEHLSGLRINVSETSVREFSSQLRQGGAA